MTIASSANHENILRSIQKWFITAFVGSTGFPADFAAGNIWWQGVRIDTSELPYFVRLTFSEVGREFHRHINQTEPGYRVVGNLLIEVWCKREAYRDTPHVLAAALATIRFGVRHATTIAVKNYADGDGLTTATTMSLARVLPVRSQEDAEWRSASIEIETVHIESDAPSGD